MSNRLSMPTVSTSSSNKINLSITKLDSKESRDASKTKSSTTGHPTQTKTKNPTPTFDWSFVRSWRDMDVAWTALH
ncbi:hypothetical protein HDU97_009796 [Phlyctochytrium planicorne]|nr:hypothetical protein HDU97_009796 [Phlyctochytrium planicorne]